MSYNTNTEKVFAVTKSVGWYGSISEKKHYPPQFRLRLNLQIPIDGVKSIGNKEQINLAAISQWKTSNSNKKKIIIHIRNLSIAEVWDKRVLLADYAGENNPETVVLKGGFLKVSIMSNAITFSILMLEY